MRRLWRSVLILALFISTIPMVAADEMAEAAFQRVWSRTDQPVAEGTAQRTWYWGPAPIATLLEDYAEAPGGQRLVQYWDKGRMEITNPNDDPDSEWYVTSGLLVRDMISGKLQVGDGEFERLGPLNLPIAGDPHDNPDAPTYASFKVVASIENPSPGEVPLPFPYGPGINEDRAALPRIGKFVTDIIARDGSVESDSSLASVAAGTRIVHYDLNGGHNIPEAFWRFLNSEGLVQEGEATRRGVLANWVYLTGYPISEPYWLLTRIGGEEQWVMAQAFERRVLTYNPANAPGWRVEMGNVGQHYYHWRNGPPAPPIELPPNVNAEVDPSSGPAGTEFQVVLYGFQPGEQVSVWLTLPDQSVVEAGELAVANEDGVAELYGDPVITIYTQPGFPSGVWILVGQGMSSGNQSIAYFEVTD